MVQRRPGHSDMPLPGRGDADATAQYNQPVLTFLNINVRHHERERANRTIVNLTLTHEV